MKKNELDDYTEMKELFNKIYDLSKPVMVGKKFEGKVLNPAIQKILEYLLNSAPSIKNEIQRNMFFDYYQKYIKFISRNFTHYSFENEINGKEKTQIRLIISFTKELLISGHKELKKPKQGFGKFHKENFKVFIKETEEIKKNWILDLENQEKVLYDKSIIHSGLTLGSGDSSLEFLS